MNVYQVIKNQYDSDDGHYTDEPVSQLVYTSEGIARSEVDGLNATSITLHNKNIAVEVAHRMLVWNKRDDKVSKYYEPYSVKATEDYARKYTFMGDPKNIDEVKRFASRDNCLTYYTVQTLTVVGA